MDSKAEYVKAYITCKKIEYQNFNFRFLILSKKIRHWIKFNLLYRTAQKDSFPDKLILHDTKKSQFKKGIKSLVRALQFHAFGSIKVAKKLC